MAGKYSEPCCMPEHKFKIYFDQWYYTAIEWNQSGMTRISYVSCWAACLSIAKVCLLMFVRRQAHSAISLKQQAEWQILLFHLSFSTDSLSSGLIYRCFLRSLHKEWIPILHCLLLLICCFMTYPWIASLTRGALVRAHTPPQGRTSQDLSGACQKCFLNWTLLWWKSSEFDPP